MLLQLFRVVRPPRSVGVVFVRNADQVGIQPNHKESNNNAAWMEEKDQTCLDKNEEEKDVQLTTEFVELCLC